MQNTVQAVKAKLSNISIPWRIVLKNVAAIVIALVALSWLHLRPLGIFFLSLFFYWLYKTRCNFRIVPPPEVEKIYQFRKNHRKLFDVIMFTFGGFFVIAGPLLTGFLLGLILIFIAVVFSSRMENDILESRRRRRDARIAAGETYFDSETESDSYDDDDEFLPETSSNNLNLLARASDLTSSLPTEGVDDNDDNESDDVPSELLIPDIIPELIENSSDDDQDISSLIAEAINRECYGSSTSSEENLLRGLNFTDSPNPVNNAARRNDVARSSAIKTIYVPAISSSRTTTEMPATSSAKTTTQMLVESTSKLLPTFVTGLMPWGNLNETLTNNNTISNAAVAAPAVVEAPKDEDRSSESEFEIINHE